ncbi:hypothetical protein [Streptomyces hiroshimensis]|uniref:Uncharacterized protein n=1 Tax=Streptomyces hiroshimensis TaxID=66424 RepID=A0ABQ2ZDQ1_9ACTN|nr:hypothetical protein [Streptomyces hiroshimensis]GGY12081.1 hypothetical protein GCM10010324_68510 [Streptomyces hiroshimensis]
MIFLDEQLIGQWCSAPLELGAMETSELVFLADGRGWSRFEGISTELSISRFRWHCPAPGRLELHGTWWVSGRWAPHTGGFAAVEHSKPDDGLFRTGYRIADDVPSFSGTPVTALTVDDAIEFAVSFARGRRAVTSADDPSSTVVPYAPPARPGPPPR